MSKNSFILIFIILFYIVVVWFISMEPSQQEQTIGSTTPCPYKPIAEEFTYSAKRGIVPTVISSHQPLIWLTLIRPARPTKAVCCTVSSLSAIVSANRLHTDYVYIV